MKRSTPWLHSAILSVSLCFNAIAANAENESHEFTGLSHNYGIQPMDECKNPDTDKAVEYITLGGDDMERAGFLFAFTEKYGNDPYIFYNKSLFPYLHPSVQKFVLAHECEHVTQGHINHIPQSVADIEKAEYEADCQAVKTLRDQFGFTQKDVDIIKTSNIELPAYFGEDNARMIEKNKVIQQCFDNPAPKAPAWS